MNLNSAIAKLHFRLITTLLVLLLMESSGKCNPDDFDPREGHRRAKTLVEEDNYEDALSLELQVWAHSGEGIEHFDAIRYSAIAKLLQEIAENNAVCRLRVEGVAKEAMDRLSDTSLPSERRVWDFVVLCVVVGNEQLLLEGFQQDMENEAKTIFANLVIQTLRENRMYKEIVQYCENPTSIMNAFLDYAKANTDLRNEDLLMEMQRSKKLGSEYYMNYLEAFRNVNGENEEYLVLSQVVAGLETLREELAIENDK